MVRLSSLLQSANDDDLSTILTEWNRDNATSFTFSDVALPQRKEIFVSLLKKMRDTSSENLITLCLESIRILCREKLGLDESFAEKEDVWLLFELANLRNTENPKATPSVRIEALKCLCNAIYNSPAVQAVCNYEDILKNLISNIDNAGDVQTALLSSKILFLVTGFNPPMRRKAFDHGAIKTIAKYLQPKLVKDVDAGSELSDCILEMAKAIFNIASSAETMTEEIMTSFHVVAELLRAILSIKSNRMNDFNFQVAALMTLLPASCFQLLIKSETSQSEEHDMTAIQKILDYLDFVLINDCDKDHLVPLFVALAHMCRANRWIRHYVRNKILPPLHEDDVRRLPQEGDTLRNRCCRLLTSTNMEIKERTADFLFVLCKENVRRFIKYTGFGNAAGLLANRGLLGRAAGRQSNINGTEFSSASDDSDTDDYLNVKDEVNPVTGRVDPPVTRNPFEGMSEEQKEYEAMQLVNAIDRLQRQGVIQPVQMGDPGTLTANSRAQQPVEHVLQMREEFLKHRQDLKNKEDEDEEN